MSCFEILARIFKDPAKKRAFLKNFIKLLQRPKKARF